MMKKALLVLLAAVALFAGYRIFVAPPQVKEGSIAYNSIICFGDSLTFGTGAEAGMDYPSQLSKMIAKPVINAGAPGDTTARALKRLQRDVLARSPDLVLITLGGNDLKNGVAKDTAFKNLEHIVESIQGQGARVILGGLKFPLRDRGFARGYKDLADKTGAVLIPDIFKDIMGNRKLMSDPIHPNGDGYRKMAQRFLDAMRPR
jgi:acyl-CoA thioesterase I